MVLYIERLFATNTPNKLTSDNNTLTKLRAPTLAYGLSWRHQRQPRSPKIKPFKSTKTKKSVCNQKPSAVDHTHGPCLQMKHGSSSLCRWCSRTPRSTTCRVPAPVSIDCCEPNFFSKQSSFVANLLDLFWLCCVLLSKSQTLQTKKFCNTSIFLHYRK